MYIKTTFKICTYPNLVSKIEILIFFKMQVVTDRAEHLKMFAVYIQYRVHYFSIGIPYFNKKNLFDSRSTERTFHLPSKCNIQYSIYSIFYRSVLTRPLRTEQKHWHITKTITIQSNIIKLQYNNFIEGRSVNVILINRSKNPDVVFSWFFFFFVILKK